MSIFFYTLFLLLMQPSQMSSEFSERNFCPQCLDLLITKLILQSQHGGIWSSNKFNSEKRTNVMSQFNPRIFLTKQLRKEFILIQKEFILAKCYGYRSAPCGQPNILRWWIYILSSKLVINFVSAPREKKANEIQPKDVQHSATKDGDYAVAHATDMDLGTVSGTVAGLDGRMWLKITLDQVYCVKEVLTFHETGKPDIKWTCSETDCDNCTISSFCDRYRLTVTGAGAAQDKSGCKYGDTVKLEKNSGTSFFVKEIAITGEAGNSHTYRISLNLNTRCRIKQETLSYM